MRQLQEQEMKSENDRIVKINAEQDDDEKQKLIQENELVKAFS